MAPEKKVVPLYKKKRYITFWSKDLDNTQGAKFILFCVLHELNYDAFCRTVASFEESSTFVNTYFAYLLFLFVCFLSY